MLAALTQAVVKMRVLLEPMGPFAIGVTEERHRGPHPRGQCAFRVRVQFPWIRNPDCSLKVEVSAEEPLLAGSVDRALIHEFPGEALVAEIPCYRPEEIAVEKLRALLQSRQHLSERGWLRNRPRDLFDLNYLWQQKDYRVDWAVVADLLPAKAKAYDVHYEGAESFLDEQVLAGIQGDWQGQLANFVVDTPSFEECKDSLRAILDEVFTRDS